MVSFLYLWCQVITTPLYVASGALGFSQYSMYLFPAMTPIQAKVLAVTVCVVSTWLVYRRIESIGRLGIAFGAITLLTGLWIIVEGVLHADPTRLIPARGALTPSHSFFSGLGAAMLFAAYDYAGYTTVCSVGGEVVRPEKNIPRSIVTAIFLVASLYLSMNVAMVVGMPWQQVLHSTYVASDFLARVQGPTAAAVVTVLILIATLAGVVALMLGSSRLPYAAAADGRFFTIFARLHPTENFPAFSVLFGGFVSAACCLFDLETVIKAASVVSIVLGSLTVVPRALPSAPHPAGRQAALPHDPLSASDPDRVRRLVLYRCDQRLEIYSDQWWSAHHRHRSLCIACQARRRMAICINVTPVIVISIGSAARSAVCVIPEESEHSIFDKRHRPSSESSRSRPVPAGLYLMKMPDASRFDASSTLKRNSFQPETSLGSSGTLKFTCTTPTRDGALPALKTLRGTLH